MELDNHIEYGHVSITSAESDSGNRKTSMVEYLTSADDPRCSAVHMLSISESVQLNGNAQQDIYVINGTVLAGKEELPTGSFMSSDKPVVLSSVTEQSVVFVYRDNLSAHASSGRILNQDELLWSAGGVHGLSVAVLSDIHHWVSLVSWQPRTRVPNHTHPRGEEIFVLSGQLNDERGSYPAGSWLRFHPYSHHAPFADRHTVILLRNGHLTG